MHGVALWLQTVSETAKNATSKVNLDMKMAHGEILSETNIVLAKIEFNELKHSELEEGEILSET